MATVFQTLLNSKRIELEQARLRYEQLHGDVAALEHLGTMKLPPALATEAPSTKMPKLSKKEKHAMREKQVIELFRRRGGFLRLTEIMAELQVSMNAAKDWMNIPIDQAPVSCPWERVNGNKSRFMLKEYDPRPQPMPEGTV